MKSLLSVVFLVGFISGTVLGMPWNKLPGSEAFQPNPDEYGNFLEGDLVLTPDQLMNPQNGILSSFYRWENNIIYYAIDSVFTVAQRAIMLSAMSEIASKTCLQFVQRTTQANYVSITGESTGCWSYIGCIRGAQQLNLQVSGGCVTKGVVMHELLHAIGFFHSQSDTSRDKYVSINYDNIISGKEHNFVLYTNSYSTAFDQPYDFESILHYGAYAFTKNGKKTIEPKLAGVTIGQRSYLSELDVKKVNIMYSCTAYL